MDGRRRVLIVDDDRYFASSLGEEFRSRGFDVVFAGGVREAKEAISDLQNFDFAILDIAIPLQGAMSLEGRGGWEGGVLLADWIAINYPNLRFLAYTNFLDARVMQRFERHGAPVFAKVGHSWRELVIAVEELISEASNSPTSKGNKTSADLEHPSQRQRIGDAKFVTEPECFATQNIHIQNFTGVLGDVTESNVQIYDYSSLHQTLKQQNVPQCERNELENIMDSLRTAKPEDKAGFLKRGKAWIVKNQEFLGATASVVRKAMGIGE